MHCFLTGATGFLGGAVAAELAARGHTIHALARSEASAQALTDRGYHVVAGSLDDLDTLTEASRAADAVFHFAVGEQGRVGPADAVAVDAMLSGLEGRGAPFLLTSGLAVFWGIDAPVVDEEHPLDDAVPWQQARIALERQVRDAAARGVRTVVLRPAHVYGHAQMGAFTRMQLGWAQEHRAGAVVGDGATPYGTVHIDDLSQAYMAALDRAPAGSLYHLVGHTLPTREVALAMAHAVGAPGTLTSLDPETAVDRFGRLADLLVRFPMVTSLRTVAELGWTPRAPSLPFELLWGSLRP